MRTPPVSRSLRTFAAFVLPFLAVGSLIVVTSCSSASSTSNATTSTTVSAPTQTITVLATSSEKVLHTAGASGEHIYGWNRLVGDGTNGTDTVNLEMLATVNYTNGSGSIAGVITFTYPDGSTIGFDMGKGTAVAASDTTDATFHCDLVVIAGSGKYATVTGTGTFDGSRKDALGGAVEMTFALRIA